MEMKSKLYLRIILSINYMMEKNLFVYVECSSVKHVASQFSVRKNVTKKKERKWHLDGLISQVQVLSVFYPEVPCTTLCWLYITLQNSGAGVFLRTSQIFQEHLFHIGHFRWLFLKKLESLKHRKAWLVAFRLTWWKCVYKNFLRLVVNLGLFC